MFVPKNTEIQYNRTTVLHVFAVRLRDDLPERLKRSTKRQFGAQSFVAIMTYACININRKQQNMIYAT
ncbi:hypothetical protein CGSMWGv00703C2mash_01969 [Gardnerella pickettii 00703C2mash]|nr:hypothetical protein CGSMWGv00703C2mash_01969 [Gardnerella pickettii 00703C2mash]